MIVEQAKVLAAEICKDVDGLNIIKTSVDRLKIALMVAKSIKKRSNDAVWQYVINNLSDKLDRACSR